MNNVALLPGVVFVGAIALVAVMTMVNKRRDERWHTLAQELHLSGSGLILWLLPAQSLEEALCSI